MDANNVRKIVTDHFDILAEQYDEKCLSREKYLNAINGLIHERLRDRKNNNLRILDVGCGTGTRTEAICSNLPGSKVYGCDISPKMLEVAKDKHFDGLECADMCDLPFEDKSFNVIFCLFNAIGYLATKRQRIEAFREFDRVLEPDGLLFIDFMNRWHLGENLSFKRSIFTASLIYLKSIFPDPRNRGNMHFNLRLNRNENAIRGFVHGFSCGEIKSLLSVGRFKGNRFIVGYDSGEIKSRKSQGQFFFIARKNS